MSNQPSKWLIFFIFLFHWEVYEVVSASYYLFLQLYSFFFNCNAVYNLLQFIKAGLQGYGETFELYIYFTFLIN